MHRVSIRHRSHRNGPPAPAPRLSSRDADILRMTTREAAALARRGAVEEGEAALRAGLRRAQDTCCGDASDAELVRAFEREIDRYHRYFHVAGEEAA